MLTNQNNIDEIDHNKVIAPYIRLSASLAGTKGDIVSTYDVRFVQPNQEALNTQQLHSLEHMFLYLFRELYSKHFVCIAPMGCQTGFYLVLLNQNNLDKVCLIMENILNRIINMDCVPYVSSEHCGQYAHHDLHEAQQAASTFLTKINDWKNVYDEE